MGEPLPGVDVDPLVGPFLVQCVKDWISGTHHAHGEKIPEEFHV